MLDMSKHCEVVMFVNSAKGAKGAEGVCVCSALFHTCTRQMNFAVFCCTCFF